MRECRVCGEVATDTVTSYNNTSWLCDNHVETFIMLATHWLYQGFQAVPYAVEIEFEAPELDKSKWKTEIIKSTGIVSLPQKAHYGTPNNKALYSAYPRGYVSPKPKHLKVSPRWHGMSDGENGECRTVDALPDGVVRIGANGKPIVTKKIHELDYASKAAIWDSSNIYTKG